MQGLRDRKSWVFCSHEIPGTVLGLLGPKRYKKWGAATVGSGRSGTEQGQSRVWEASEVGIQDTVNKDTTLRALLNFLQQRFQQQRFQQQWNLPVVS